MNTAANDDPAGRPPSGLVDLVTRHFDGGLSAEEQRRLADWLASSPAARATFARCLRLEGGMIRMAAAGLLGPRTPTDGAAVTAPAVLAPAVLAPAVPAPAVPTPAVPTVPAARLRAGVIAIAGGLLAAVVLVVASGGLPERGGPPAAGDRGPIDGGSIDRGSIDRVADRWLERRAAEPAAGATGDADDDPTREADDPGTDAAQPPSWLVAAVADEHAEATSPDAS